MKLILSFFPIIVYLIFFIDLGYSASSGPVFGKNGMVVSTSKQASEAGIKILKKGGNAVDAAVAVGFALAVTSSSNGNIGGGGFMVYTTSDGESFTLDFREKAPVIAHRDLFIDDSGKVIPGMSLYSRSASGVPGTVDGLTRALDDHGSGKITLLQALLPAIRLADKGYELSHYEAERFNAFKTFFDHNDAAAYIFNRNDGQRWEKGDRFIQKDLARTLKRIGKYGRDGFYAGPISDMIVEEMKRGNGLITYEDLQNYSSIYRIPVTGKYREYDIVSMGPPSSGGTLLINMFNQLSLFALDTMGWNSSQYIHYLTEVERRAYADRAEHMGDPDYWDVPVQFLTDTAYAKETVQTIMPNRASLSSDIQAGNPWPYESRETTHYSVVDKDGNAVSVTTTLNTSYGCGILVDGAGFFLNNEMDDFSSKPGVPNVYGLVGKEANAIQPGKRPLSSMTPTIVLKENKPFMIIGSPGGSTIITTSLQTILNVVLHEMDIKEAVSAPRVHSQWLPDIIMTEPRGVSRDVKRNLKAMGHVVMPYKWGHIGEANGILITEDGFYGGGDSRGETSAVGY